MPAMVGSVLTWHAPHQAWIRWAPLDVPRDRLAWLATRLSPDEEARSQRYRRELDRHRFIASRATLREILAVRLQRAPEAIRFSYGAFGKPGLVRSHGDPDIRFNLAHAGGWVVYAVTSGQDVGIDVEEMETDPATVRAAERSLASEEIGWLNRRDAGERRADLWRLWTLKEACLKATGEGLTRDPRSFVIDPDGPGILGWRSGDDRVWNLSELPAPAGFKAALCTQARQP